MKNLFRLNKIFVGIALLVMLVSVAMGINASETTKNIRIIYTNDTSGYVDPCG